jgi:hydroxymethylglutaryl-CoA lyase
MIAPNRSLELVECPRDAMQGWKKMIPTSDKIAYLNRLLEAGFHTLDFGSFVSPKAIPQMADTSQVLDALQWRQSKTGLLAIVANLRGAREACLAEGIRYIGYPFSISPTFQQRNTHADLEASFQLIEEIQELCVKTSRQLVVYLSMAFGNPYGDFYDPDEVVMWAEKCHQSDVQILSLADTVGLANAEEVGRLVSLTINALPEARIGVHLHSTPQHRQEKLQAAWDAGCRRFDAAVGGFGGCPMAGDDLVGNLDMAWLVSFFESQGIPTGIDQTILSECTRMAAGIFSH